MGVCMVSTADNVIRPLVISGATQIPFLLIMFGVLGGLASFGMVDFLSARSFWRYTGNWREWLHETNETEGLMMPKATLAHDIDDETHHPD